MIRIQEETEETKKLAENKLLEKDTLGFLSKYDQQQYEEKEHYEYN